MESVRRTRGRQTYWNRYTDEQIDKQTDADRQTHILKTNPNRSESKLHNGLHGGQTFRTIKDTY